MTKYHPIWRVQRNTTEFCYHIKFVFLKIFRQHVHYCVSQTDITHIFLSYEIHPNSTDEYILHLVNALHIVIGPTGLRPGDTFICVSTMVHRWFRYRPSACPAQLPDWMLINCKLLARKQNQLIQVIIPRSETCSCGYHLQVTVKSLI